MTHGCSGSEEILRKYSIDEFPQFFSLLAGNLTFVGPRVVSHEEISRYGDALSKLLSVKPGMTGFWQVMAGKIPATKNGFKWICST